MGKIIYCIMNLGFFMIICFGENIWVVGKVVEWVVMVVKGCVVFLMGKVGWVVWYVKMMDVWFLWDWY